ncbi:MAG: carboxynorspermidine decarboxylase [Candidatus Omnitrophica bacterium]|nr:carboxynorspermidine decarboxylase [Candidatus Omnitrophota bacterium]
MVHGLNMNLNFVENLNHTPCYVVDKALLKRNLEILGGVEKKTGAKILLALKGFAMFSLFPVIREYLSGTAASSLYEARLGFEEFGEEVHACAPAFRDDEFEDILMCSSHITFNSFTQWARLKPRVAAFPKPVKCALRINPEHSEVKVPIYDPCAPGSRLGIPIKAFRGKDIEGIKGLHFHTLCELNSDALERTLKQVETKFGEYLYDMEWVNFGGGHHITRNDYDIPRLCRIITDFSAKYKVQVYLEPGEAIALNTGYLVASVLDVIPSSPDIAILDTSAAAHMPDVLEMPYRPVIAGSGDPGELQHTYKLGGMTCLAGDIIGEYSFNKPLKPGMRLVLKDMAHYTMVKNNTFNGINLPSIVIYDPDGNKLETVRTFSYEDYRNRLS